MKVARDLLSDELSSAIHQQIENVQMQLVSMHELHIPMVLELESEIRQYASHEQSNYFKKGLIKNFIDWHKHNQARCIVIQSIDKVIQGYAILILDADKIKGFYEPFSYKLDDCAYLAQVVVNPANQGTGLGKLLMEILENLCVYHGKKHLLLEVHSLTPAYQFYRHSGYQLDFYQAFMSKTLKS